MAEFLDIFDANMAPIAPFQMEKKEVHQKGHWHQTFHCWILRRDAAGRHTVLLQLRDPAKSDGANTFDISAAGHLVTGETVMDGIREIKEELGIDVDHAHLLPLGIFKQSVVTSKGELNYEFCHTFFYESANPVDQYQLQPDEVAGLFEISITDAIALFSGETDSVEITGIIRTAETYAPAKQKIGVKDMCAAKDRCTLTPYYLKIFTLADLYFKGYRPLAI